MTNHGILLLAHGKETYLHMAWNLAHMLRAQGTTAPIALLTDLAGRIPRPVPFDSVIQLDKAHAIPFYAKTNLNRYTPFDRTMFLDVDAFPVKALDDLFTGEGFRIQTQKQSASGPGPDHPFMWASPAKVFDFYGLPPTAPWTETNSSFIVWDKGPEADAIFKAAEHCYGSKPYPGYARNIGHYPDELAFNVALSYLGIRPNWERPIYFCDPTEAPDPMPTIAERFYLVGLYGNASTTHRALWTEYDRRRTGEIKRITGQYGFKVDVQGKLTNKVNPRPEWTGLRPPQDLDAIFG